MSEKVAIKTGKRGRPMKVEPELAAAVQALVDSGVSPKDALKQAKDAAKASALATA